MAEPRPHGRALLATALALALAAPAAAQDPGPTVRGILTGYGATGYSATLEDDFQNGFSGLLAPVVLFQVGDDLLVEGELELAFHDRETLVVLEHLQLHYLVFDRIQLKAGRFHLPIGVWNHTNWINKLPTPPLLYEDTHGEAARHALMPIPFDLGAMARWTFPLVDGWRTSAAAWVSQGPRPGGEAHGHAGEDGGHHDEGAPASDAPALSWGSNYEDNNPDKMAGLRLRAVSGSDLGLTLQGSAFRSRYDDASDLGLSGGNLALIWTPGAGPSPLFDLRAEGTILRQEYLHHESVESVRSEGYYVQVSRRFGALEPVVRWSHLPRATAGHGPLVEKRRRLAVGLIHWLGPSIPLKIAYNRELDDTDRFFIEWAVGF